MSALRVQLSEGPYESEGLRLVTISSEALGGRGDATLWLGPGGGTKPEGLIILLHGVYGSHWSWSLCGGAHRTLARLIDDRQVPPLALVMPSDGLWGDGSAYLRHHGHDYGRWIIDEVPQVAMEIAGVRPDAALFIGGASMGGYGALRLAALHPHRFRAVSGHSVVTRLDDLARFAARVPCAGDIGESALDVIDAMRASVGGLPPLRFDCGLEDDLLGASRELHEQLGSDGIAHRYEEAPGGHDWSYWSRRLSESFRWFAEHV